MLTQATHLTAQTNTAYHKIGHLIGAAKRCDISAAYCAHTSNTSNSTTYHKIGPSHQKMAAHCAHTSNTSNSTNKHSLSQDGSEPPKDGSILCSHKQHNTQRITRWVRATKRCDISAAYCAHTPNTDTATSITSSLSQDVRAAKASRSLQRDVQLMCPILPLMGKSQHPFSIACTGH